MSPAERSLRARLAAYAMHARHDARRTSANGRAAFLARFEREVDPDGRLDPRSGLAGLSRRAAPTSPACHWPPPRPAAPSAGAARAVMQRDRTARLAGAGRLPQHRDRSPRPVLRRDRGGRAGGPGHLPHLPRARRVPGLRGPPPASPMACGAAGHSRSCAAWLPSTAWARRRFSGGAAPQRQQGPLRARPPLRRRQHLLHANRGAALPQLPPGCGPCPRPEPPAGPAAALVAAESQRIRRQGGEARG